MPEPDPIAEQLAQVAGEHELHASLNICTGCKWRARNGAGSLAKQHRVHLAEVQAAALRDAAETEWAAVDNGHVIHIPGATCPADVLAGAHGHGNIQVGVARRQVIRTPWQPTNHGQENP